MSDVKNIAVGNTVLDIKDDEARDQISELSSNLAYNTITAPTPASASLSVDDGGYTQVGKIVVVNVRIVISTAISSNAQLLSGFPSPKNNHLKNIVAVLFGNIAQVIPCYLNNSGNLYTNSNTPTGTYLLHTVYIAN